MSNLSQAERDKLPAAKFALPKQRLYPVLDQEDVDKAARLVGKHPEAKAGIVALAKAGGWKLPDSWTATTANHAATFADSDMVIKSGKIFTAGDYPDKNFSLSPEELFAAAVNYAPGTAIVRDTHPLKGQSYLEGKYGYVAGVTASDDGTELFADVALSKWYADLLPPGELKVSCEWNRKEKQLEGLGVLTNPAIEDASIFAAFAKATHKTPEGQQLIQSVHDMVSRGGADCNDPASYSSKSENKAAQAIHDICSDNGAECGATTAGRRGGSYSFFQREDDPDRVEVGSVVFAAAQEQRGGLMSKWDGFRKWVAAGMKGDPPEDAVAPFAAVGTQTDTSTHSKEETSMTEQERAEMEALRKDVRTERAKRIEAEAVAFADGEIHEHRAYPYEREGLIVEYQQAADDDSKAPATFGGEGTSRVEQMKKRHAARPAHALTKETEDLTAEQLAVFMKQPLQSPMVTPRAADKPMTEARHNELMGYSDVGRAAMNGANKH